MCPKLQPTAVITVRCMPSITIHYIYATTVGESARMGFEPATLQDKYGHPTGHTLVESTNVVSTSFQWNYIEPMLNWRLCPVAYLLRYKGPGLLTTAVIAEGVPCNLGSMLRVCFYSNPGRAVQGREFVGDLGQSYQWFGMSTVLLGPQGGKENPLGW